MSSFPPAGDGRPELLSQRCYEIADINRRESGLLKILDETPDCKEAEMRLFLLRRRYGSVSSAALLRAGSRNRRPRPDAFMRAWLSLKTSGLTERSFFGRQKKAAEFRSCFSALCLPAFFPSPYLRSGENPSDIPDSDSTLYLRLLREEWTDFARLLLKTCLSDRNYGSVAFGMIPVGEDALIRRIANEINYVTRELPAAFLQEESCRDFRETICAAYALRFPDSPLP